MSVMRPSVVVCADHSIILVRSHQTRSDARSHEPATATAAADDDAASNLRGVKRRRQTRHPTRADNSPLENDRPNYSVAGKTTGWAERTMLLFFQPCCMVRHFQSYICDSPDPV